MGKENNTGYFKISLLMKIFKGFDYMRISGNEKNLENLNMQYLTMDVLKSMMNKTEDLNSFSNQVTELIRDIILCKTVVLMRTVVKNAEESDQLVSIAPMTHMKNLNELFFFDITNQLKEEKDIIYWTYEEVEENIEIHNNLVEFSDILILPLYSNNKKVGFLLCLDLDKENNLGSTIELLKSLTGFISTVLQNTILQEKRDVVIEERSKQLVNNELFLDALTNVLSVGILKTDINGKIEYLNKKSLEIFEDVEGSVFDLIWVDLIKDAYKYGLNSTDWKELFLEPDYQIEFRKSDNSREKKWYVIRVSPLTLNKVDGYVVTITDNTICKLKEIEVQKKVEESSAEIEKKTEEFETMAQNLMETRHHLKLAQEQLLEQEKMASLGRLVSEVAHEINTPVGIGITTTTYLGEEIRAFKTKYKEHKISRADFDDFLDSMEESTKILKTNLRRAAEMTRSFKDVVVDQAIDDHRRFNVCEYVEEILMSLKPKLRNGGHHINLYCSEKIVINSYPGAFSQIITNLFMNSIIHGFDKFSSGVMDITLNEEEEFLEIIFEDNGKGIVKSNLSKIYDPFFTTNRNGGSTGLGLHIVHNLVANKLKGTIKCESGINDFTRFTIRLPIMR